MKRYALAIMVIASIQAKAATKAKHTAPPKFIVNGVETEPTKALISAVNGETVYKCQLVEAKVSKSLTSIGLKTVKQ